LVLCHDFPGLPTIALAGPHAIFADLHLCWRQRDVTYTC
jgi:hypothetical protein